MACAAPLSCPHREQGRLARVAQVHRHAHLARDHVARVGLHLHVADGAAPTGNAWRCGSLRASICAAATGARPCAGASAWGRVGVLAGDRDVEPAHALRALHHAHRGCSRPRAPGPARCAPRSTRRPCAAAPRRGSRSVERFAHAMPSASRFSRICSNSKTPANTPEPIIVGTKREPSSLVQHATSSGARGARAGVVQRAHDLQPGHDAVGAVELAAVRLRVEVAAHHDRRRGCLAPGAAREHVADRVDPHFEPGFAAPAREALASFTVGGVSVTRRTPPFGVAPIVASSISEDQRRSASILGFDIRLF